MDTPLIKLRKQKGLTSIEVAREVGCDKSQYGRIERGISTPSPKLAAQIASYFGHAITELQILYPERYVDAQSEVAKAVVA